MEKNAAENKQFKNLLSKGFTKETKQIVEVEDRPDFVILQIGHSDITHNAVDQIDVKDIVTIINIAKKYLSCGIKEVITSSILIKKLFKLTKIIRQVNNFQKK